MSKELLLPTATPLSLPEAIANLRKLQKFFGQLFEAQPAIKSIDRVIEAALAQSIKDEEFEQKLYEYTCRVRTYSQYKAGVTGAIAISDNAVELARAAVLSAHANAIAQAERAGMERAGDISDGIRREMISAARFSEASGVFVSTKAIRADMSQPAAPEPQSDAIAELVDGLERGAQVNLPDFLDWLADRLVNIYQENPNVDFVLSCRSRAKHLRALITKYKP